jgi:hypothetical protein
VCRRVEIASPRVLAPLMRVLFARVSPAGGAFEFEDEVDPAKVDRGVKAGVRRVVVNSAHDAPAVSALLGGWSDERPAVGPIDRAHTGAETLPP